MSYTLGIDVGTTYTAAGIWRDGRTETVQLGDRAITVPTVLFMREDGGFLVGESADRRAVAEPARVAREFKRRLGDQVPMLLGGHSVMPQDLLTHLLDWVLDRVTGHLDGLPEHVTLTHPATWSAYRRKLLVHAASSAGLPQPQLLPEPVAAAIYYATTNEKRLPPGALIGVYDFGGGTFDATVVRRTDTAAGFELVGQPAGDDALGGVDLDQAVVDHVAASLGERWLAVDLTDPAVRSAVAQIRAHAVNAKESLSTDLEATIPVILPGITKEVRLVRPELDELIRDLVLRTIWTFRGALDQADVDPGDLHSILLVGGSSRIPLIAELLAAEFGVPIAVNADPKFAVCLGAAISAAGRAAPASSTAPVGDTVGAPAPTEAVDAAATGMDTGSGTDIGIGADAEPVVPVGVDTGPATDPELMAVPGFQAGATEAAAGRRRGRGRADDDTQPIARVDPEGPRPGGGGADDDQGRRRKRALALIGGAVGAVVLITSVALAALPDRGGSPSTSSIPAGTTAPTTTTPPTTSGGVAAKAGGFEIEDGGRVESVTVGELDGRPIAISTGSDNLLRVWDLATHEEVGEPLAGHTNKPESAAIGELDGRQIVVSGAQDGTVRVWDLASRQQIGEPLTGHTGGVFSVALSQVDGRPVAVSGGRDRRLRVWDLTAHKALGEPLRGHSGEIIAVATGEIDGRPVAVSGGTDRTVRIWDLTTRKQVGRPLFGHGEGVVAMAVGELDGRPVAVSGSHDHTVRVWDLTNRRQLGKPMTGHNESVVAVAIGELDGKPIVVSGAYDRELRVWDLATHDQIGEPFVGHEDRVVTVAATQAGGRPIAVSGALDHTLHVWDLTAG